MNKIKTIFYLLIVNSVLIFLIQFLFFIPIVRYVSIGLGLLLFVTFSLLGIVLIIFTKKEKITGKLKTFLLLTGYSSAGFFVAVILHNLVYGLLIYLFGESIWNGGDEPVFFILALVVVPIVFIIGVIGSWIKLRKR